MLDTLLTILLVTLFVLGLFGVVRWVLGFFPQVNSPRWNPPIGKWWIVLLLIVIWLEKVSDLLRQTNPSQWTTKEYVNVFYLCALSYSIVFFWRFVTKPVKGSTPADDSNPGGDRSA
ncbi:MAG: hypothetical protein ACKO23_02370 [Gemmataceae bacterium]